MLNLNRKIEVQPTFTRSQWQLYDVPELLFDASDASGVLNRQLAFLVNVGHSKDAVRQQMHEFMGEFSEYGATDSEPMAFLERVLGEIYGTS